MKECPQCQKGNPSSANYCMYCQKPLVENDDMDKIDKLHHELNDAKETIQLLKKVLSEEQEKKTTQAETIPHPHPDAPTPTTAIQEPERINEPEAKEQSKPFPWAVLIVGIILLLGVGGAISFLSFYLPYVTDRNAPRYYTFATNVFLRSSQISGVEHNQLGIIPYGSELIVYNYGSEWSQVKWQKQKGYVSSNFILPEQDFSILNSIWGDNESKETINTGKCRLALLNYFKSNRYSGNWQIFSKAKDSKYNSSYYKRVINQNSKFTDFAVIIKNTTTKERKCLLFSFSDDETPHLEYEEVAPPTGDISSISKVSNMSFNTCDFKIEYR